jgi:aryl-alcohol dehydrogenase
MAGFRADRPTSIADSDGQPLQGRWFGQSSFADRCVVDAKNAVRVAESEQLSILGPLACSVLTGAGAIFNSLAVSPGGSVAVLGTGTVGLSAVMAAQVAGASVIAAVDLQPERLELARELGATHAVAPGEDLLAQLRRIAPGGFEAVLDTTGVPAVISAGVDALRMRGVCALVGVPRGELSLRSDQFALGRTVTGVLEGDAVPRLLIPRMIELWQSGRFPFDRLVTTYPLSEINQAEADLHAGRVIKPVLIP